MGMGMGACADGDLWTPDCDGALCPDDPGCPVGTYASTDADGCNALPCVSLLSISTATTAVTATTSGIDPGTAALGLVALFAIIMMGEG